MSALMAEPRDLGRQESLFEGLAPSPPNPWAPPRVSPTPPREEVLAEPETEVAGESWEPRVAGAPLAGPTLDDVMSRVWEGLVTGLPAACPVCHGEVVPALGGPVGGHCTTCKMTID